MGTCLLFLILFLISQIITLSKHNNLVSNAIKLQHINIKPKKKKLPTAIAKHWYIQPWRRKKSATTQKKLKVISTHTYWFHNQTNIKWKKGSWPTHYESLRSLFEIKSCHCNHILNLVTDYCVCVTFAKVTQVKNYTLN